LSACILPGLRHTEIVVTTPPRVLRPSVTSAPIIALSGNAPERPLLMAVG